MPTPLSRSMPEGGRLIMVVGPSGVGKDTLINGARSAAPARVHFQQREITRPADAGGEDHIEVSAAEFEQREAEGGYALSWRANGLCYGVPASIRERIAAGWTVIVNGSRGALEEARARFPELLIVSVSASADQLHLRLANRGRESPEEIERRVARALAFEVEGKDVVEVRNDGAPEVAVQALLRLL